MKINYQSKFLRILYSWTAQLEIGEKLGTGSTGRLYKGKYLSQDVAIKIIEIDEYNGSGTDSDTHRSAPAAERLQIYKQEVSIMRWAHRQFGFKIYVGGVDNFLKFCDEEKTRACAHTLVLRSKS